MNIPKQYHKVIDALEINTFGKCFNFDTNKFFNINDYKKYAKDKLDKLSQIYPDQKVKTAKQRNQLITKCAKIASIVTNKIPEEINNIFYHNKPVIKKRNYGSLHRRLYRRHQRNPRW